MLKNTQKNKQIQQNIPNIPPFNIFLKSVLKKIAYLGFLIWRFQSFIVILQRIY